MPIESPVIKISCDAHNCGVREENEIPVMFQTYSGSSGFYDWNEALKQLRAAGWQIPRPTDRDSADLGDEGFIYCPQHADEVECNTCGDTVPRDQVNKYGDCPECKTDDEDA